MPTIYKFSRPLYYLLIFVSGVFFLLFVTLGVVIDGYHWGFIFVGVLGGSTSMVLAYFLGKSRITTSDEYIEWEYLWIKVKTPWKNVERLYRDDYSGIITLVFKNPIHDKNSLLFISTRNNMETLDLSPYIKESTLPNLLDEIARYAPTRHNLSLVKKFNPKREIKLYEYGEIIGIYYFIWFFFCLIPSFFLYKLSEYLFQTDMNYGLLLFPMIFSSFCIGLFFGAMELLNFNARSLKLSKKKLSQTARSHYLNPIVILLMSYIIGTGIWLFGQRISIDFNFGLAQFFISVLIGVSSLGVSSRIERLFFHDTFRS